MVIGNESIESSQSAIERFLGSSEYYIFESGVAAKGIWIEDTNFETKTNFMQSNHNPACLWANSGTRCQARVSA